MNVEELRKHLGLDSLAYLSLPGLLESTGIEIRRTIFAKPVSMGAIRFSSTKTFPKTVWNNRGFDKPISKYPLDFRCVLETVLPFTVIFIYWFTWPNGVE
jgi:hypothetical protein